jgi:hypothetical protein
VQVGLADPIPKAWVTGYPEATDLQKRFGF